MEIEIEDYWEGDTTIYLPARELFEALQKELS